MTKQFKRHFLLSTILFVLLLTFSIFSSMTSNVYASEPDIQDKTMEVLNYVIGINTEKYNTIINPQFDDQYFRVPQKEFDITLASADGGFRASCSFVNNSLHQIFLSDFKGPFSVEKPVSDTVKDAKDVLVRYQNYVRDSFYGEIASMLDDVDASKNSTESTGNVKLEISNVDQKIVDYIWRYVDEDGNVAKSKSVIISYENGRLKSLLNNWPLYKVVTGTPKISEQEATTIAIEASKTFSYEISTNNETTTITGFEIAPESLGHATLSYLNFPNQSLAREKDPFTLYPSWYVPLGFEKSYPGDVTGMTVTVWADTGEVSTTNPMVFSIPLTIAGNEKGTPNTTDTRPITNQWSQHITMLSFAVAITITSSLFGFALIIKKNSKFTSIRKRFPKFALTLLCGTALLSIVFVTAPMVNADSAIPNSKARTYAAYYGNPDQLQCEIDASDWVCEQIVDAYESSGYSATNSAGAATLVGNVMSYASSDQSTYDNITIFHFGHQSSPNWGYQDNGGTEISWANLTDSIDTNKHIFVFMWVCCQARAPTYGVPLAWTHRDNDIGGPYMSANGYTSPDNLGQCYIGFDWYSPMIGLTNGTFKNEITGPVKNFIDSFYDYALRESYTINEALHLASMAFFSEPFTSSVLYNGYSAWWPGDDAHFFVPPLWDAGWFPDEFQELKDPPYNWDLPETNKMRVFGDGSLRLFHPKITLTSTVGSPTFYLDGSAQSTGDVHVWPKAYTVGVSTIPGYEFDKFTYNGGNYGQNSTTIGLIYDGTLKAVYTNQGQYSLTVSTTSGGTTDPSPGTYWYDPSTPVQVTAYPSQDYEFSQWLLDGEPYSTNPTVTITMNSSYNLQAQFYYDDTKILWMTALEGGTTNPAPGYYFYWTGEYVNITAIPDEGYHFKRWILNGWSIYQNPYTIQMNVDCNAYAEFETDIPYHNVWTNAVDIINYWDMYVPLYIDGEYAGTTTSMYNLPEGNHTFQVPYYWYGSYDYQFVEWYLNGLYYSSSTTITVNIQDYTTLHIAYYPS